MITKLSIENFKIFQKFTLENLGRVNLFVGKNSVGKSCLLEAIRLYASKGDYFTARDILAKRDEFIQSNNTPTPKDALNSLINNLARTQHTNNRIRITSEPDINAWLEVHVGSTDFTDDIAKSYIAFEHAYATLHGGKIQKSSTIYMAKTHDFAAVNGIYFIGNTPVPIEIQKHKCLQVASYTHNLSNLPELWDMVDLSAEEKYVIDCLKLIDERISGISFPATDSKDVMGDRGGQPQPDVRIPTVRLGIPGEKVPLKSLGDGIYRILHIALALANASNGILLIDEIENGLHWSVQPKLWQIIFQLASKLDIQVFATSHSQDCVKAFYSAWSEHSDEGAFFRLERYEDDIISFDYNLEDMRDSISTMTETR